MATGNRSNKPVQTPGAVQPAEQAKQETAQTAVAGENATGEQQTQQAGVMGHPGVNSAPQQTIPPGSVILSAEDFDRLMSRIEAVESAPQNRMSKPAAVSLPDQSEVNSATIKQPQLTKDGWVVPDHFGANPNGQKL